MRLLIRLILQLLFRTRLLGNRYTYFTKPAIIIPNHVSFLDAILLYAYLPADTCFVINTNIAKKISFILAWVEHISIDPLNPYALKRVISVVKSGRPLVIFPEGRITTTGSLMKVYSGIGLIAAKTNATLYPVTFMGPEYSKLSRLQGKLKTRWFPQISIFFGDKIQIQPTALKLRQQKQELSNRVLMLLQENAFLARQAVHTTDNIFNRLLQAKQRFGAKHPIAEDLSASINYRRLLIGSYTLATRLKVRLHAEQVLGVLLPNSLAHLTTLLSLSYLGKTPAILNFSAGIDKNLESVEAATLTSVITSRTFIDKAQLHRLVEELSTKVQIIYLEDIKAELNIINKLLGTLAYWRKLAAPSDAHLILFTSGSESKPKGVLLSHRSILANIDQIASVIDYTSQDKMLNALPMFHSFGLTAGTLLPILSGMKVMLYPTPLHYRIIPELAYDRNITVILGTPTFLAGYAKYASPYDFYSLRLVLAGGERLKPEIRQLWLDKFGIRIYEGYGTTETGPVLSLNTPLFYQADTVGRFLPGIHFKLDAVPGINDGGNLLVNGPNLMTGYLLHGQGLVPVADWYDCGDIVTVDADGFVQIKSRLKRFAKISGEMVSLDAVETTAQQCFETTQVAAVASSDPKKGEKVVLFTVSKTASKPLLREFMKYRSHSMLFLPAEIRIIDRLPLLSSGKTDYVALQALLAKDE